jgi:hypothetical protein
MEKPTENPWVTHTHAEHYSLQYQRHELKISILGIHVVKLMYFTQITSDSPKN